VLRLLTLLGAIIIALVASFSIEGKEELCELLEKEKEHAAANIKSTMFIEPKRTRGTRRAKKIKGINRLLAR
jgi:hypothetical protein